MIPWDRSGASLAVLAELTGFRGRAYGVLAYDLGLPEWVGRNAPPVTQPLAEWFEPEHELVIDLEAGRVITGDIEELPHLSPGVTEPGCGARARLLDRSFEQAGFESSVGRIREYIASGDVYQVNLSVAERFALEGRPWDIYLALREINPSPWMGFADFGGWQVVSGSPELLVETRPGASGVEIRTRPIAGTRKKTGKSGTDAAMRTELALDEKEQAEHRMLLDLARNDLGRVASYGSVRVTEREVIEEYSHVFHLVSEVAAVVRPGCAPWQVVEAVFPGGTITGAPKIRAMEVISELEPAGRGAYTGALGWMGPDGMQLNILIRSAVVSDGIAAVQAGAGIVWDSDPAREWRESLRKAEALRMALGVGS